MEVTASAPLPSGGHCPLSWSKASSGEKGLRDEERKFSWHSLAPLFCPLHLTAHTFLEHFHILTVGGR